jgi:DNA-directed RNA polymerase specialized sigma24 family protein
MDEQIELALLSVDPTLRDIIVLRYFEGWSYKATGKNSV